MRTLSGEAGGDRPLQRKGEEHSYGIHRAFLRSQELMPEEEGEVDPLKSTSYGEVNMSKVIDPRIHTWLSDGGIGTSGIMSQQSHGNAWLPPVKSGLQTKAEAA